MYPPAGCHSESSNDGALADSERHECATILAEMLPTPFKGDGARLTEASAITTLHMANNMITSESSLTAELDTTSDGRSVADIATCVPVSEVSATHGRQCAWCKTMCTPAWRHPVDGLNHVREDLIVCNACGLRTKRLGKHPGAEVTNVAFAPADGEENISSLAQARFAVHSAELVLAKHGVTLALAVPHEPMTAALSAPTLALAIPCEPMTAAHVPGGAHVARSLPLGTPASTRASAPFAVDTACVTTDVPACDTAVMENLITISSHNAPQVQLVTKDNVLRAFQPYIPLADAQDSIVPSVLSVQETQSSPSMQEKLQQKQQNLIERQRVQILRKQREQEEEREREQHQRQEEQQRQREQQRQQQEQQHLFRQQEQEQQQQHELQMQMQHQQHLAWQQQQQQQQQYLAWQQQQQQQQQYLAWQQQQQQQQQYLAWQQQQQQQQQHHSHLASQQQGPPQLFGWAQEPPQQVRWAQEPQPFNLTQGFVW